MKQNEYIVDKKVVVIGLSRSGKAVGRLAKKKKAHVYVSEITNNELIRRRARFLQRQNINVELGKHTQAFLKGADLIVTSPGVKSDAPPLVWAKKNKIQVVSEIEFASWFSKVPIVAITGSNGKTTVTTLLGQIAKDAGRGVVVCGNIGVPFSEKILKHKSAEFIILEVSSFQLQYIKKFSPYISIILNITQNHLDYHHSMKEYKQAKSNILINQKADDFTILNFDDKKVKKFSKTTKAKTLFFSKEKKDLLKYIDKCYGACWLDGKNIFTYWQDKYQKVVNVDELNLKGMHNIENVMVCVLAVCVLGIKKEKMLKTLKKFKGLEHRCELVRRKRGIAFINDSKSTTVDATAKALSIFEDHSVILIAGGRDKESDFSLLKSVAKKKISLLVLIGEAKYKIRNSLTDNAIKCVFANTLKQAVQLAYKNADANTTILFSPMCSSFDMFDNFEHRGKVFKSIVRSI